MTLGLIKPTVCAYRPNVLRALRRIQALNSIEIVRTKSVHWNTNDAAAFYAEHQGKFYYNRLILGMTSGPSLALALSGRDAIRTWRELIGPTKAYRTAWEQPHTLRGEFGLGDTRNGFHGSDSIASALAELSLVFPEWNAGTWLGEAKQKNVE